MSHQSDDSDHGDQDEPRDGRGRDEDALERDEDRAQILERRKRLIASALAGIALGAEGCERIMSIAAPCLEPMAVDSGVRPNVCLAYMPPEDGVPQPCLAQRATPYPCLQPPRREVDASDAGGANDADTGSDGSASADGARAQSDPSPRTCLSISRPPPPRPRVCLSARMRPCLNVLSEESSFKEDDSDEG